MKVLLIDDDPAVLEVVALMLGAQGHAVVTAVGGRDGLARLSAGKPIDLVFQRLMGNGSVNSGL